MGFIRYEYSLSWPPWNGCRVSFNRSQHDSKCRVATRPHSRKHIHANEGLIGWNSGVTPNKQAKPTYCCIRPIGPDHADFIHYHLHEQLKCLSHFFRVIQIVDDDCDIKRLCEIHKPDLALFESGVYVSLDKATHHSQHRRISQNTKLGLCNADAYCQTRKVFLSDKYRWNVNTFFTISLSMAEYTPEIADHLYAWPNFADGDLYKGLR